MSSSKRSANTLVVLLIIASLASIFTFTYRNHKNFYQTPIDFLIFLRAGEVYKETGQLYERANHYAEEYHPSAAIYKFPPAFQLIIKPFTYLPADMNAQAFLRLLFSGMYILSILLLFFYMRSHVKLKGVQTFYFATLLTIVSCWFMPFFECIRWLLAEIPLLLIFVGSFLLLTKNRFFAAISGGLIAFATCIKLYPIFLFGYHLLQKNRAALVGFVGGLIATLTASVMLFGLPEHIFYLKNILPVLMQEPVTDKWVNLNLEKFLFMIGLIPEVSGNIFTITRAFFVGGLLACLFLYRHSLQKHNALVFSLFITTMFFCFPNYWPQYQLFLIIPISYLAADAIKHHHKPSLILLCLAVLPLFIPDLLWQQVLGWDAMRHDLDIEMIGKESYLNGTSITLLKYSPLTWVAYYLYEYRAVTPIILWLMLVLQLRKRART